jgi:hypothetical protein
LDPTPDPSAPTHPSTTSSTSLLPDSYNRFVDPWEDFFRPEFLIIDMALVVGELSLREIVINMCGFIIHVDVLSFEYLMFMIVLIILYSCIEVSKAEFVSRELNCSELNRDSIRFLLDHYSLSTVLFLSFLPFM